MVKLGSIATKTIGLYLFTTGLAVTTALIFGWVFNLSGYEGEVASFTPVAGEASLYDTVLRIFPNNIFGAGFIGCPSMNFVYATATKSGKGMKINFGENEVKVASAPKALMAYEGKEIVVGIRPEAFEDSVYANEKEFSEYIEIEISLLEQLGSDTYVHFYKDIKPVQTEAIAEILADEGEDISVLGSETKFIARINPNSSVEEGQKINLALDPTKLHYFDPDTGLAIT